MVVGVPLLPRVHRGSVGADQDRIVDLVPGTGDAQAPFLELVVLQVLKGRDDVVEVHDGLYVEVAFVAHKTSWRGHPRP